MPLNYFLFRATALEHQSLLRVYAKEEPHCTIQNAKANFNTVFPFLPVCEK